MANLEQLIAAKEQNDRQWKLERQAERENAVALQDAAITEITSNPDAYGRYLNVQGDNPGYSPGNIAMVMFQQPEFTKFCTAERWRNLGRSVMESQKDNGAKLFARATFGRGYSLTDAYDITQTQGRTIAAAKPLENDSAEMSKALTTLLNYSVVPIVADRNLSEPARYDAGKLELYINPAHEDDTLFAAIAAEIAHARIHGKGINAGYTRAECELDARSISYILCRRFGVACELPDRSSLAALYEDWSPQDRRAALDQIQNMSKQIGGSIERDITPPGKSRIQNHTPTR